MDTYILSVTIQALAFICMSRIGTSQFCEQNWNFHNENCYYVTEGNKSWEEVKEICKNLNGSLTSIHDESENRFVADQCSPKSHCYIGLYNLKTNQGLNISDVTFLWVDGSNLTYSPPWNKVNTFFSNNKYGVSIDAKERKWWRIKKTRVPNWQKGHGICKKPSTDTPGINLSTQTNNESNDTTMKYEITASMKEDKLPQTTENNGFTGHLTLDDLLYSGQNGEPLLDLFNLSKSADGIEQSLLSSMPLGETESWKTLPYLNTSVIALNANWSDVGYELNTLINMPNCSYCRIVVLSIDLRIINASKTHRISYREHKIHNRKTGNVGIDGEFKMVGRFISISVYSNLTTLQIPSTSFTLKKTLSKDDRHLNAHCSFIDNKFMAWFKDGCTTEIQNNGDVTCTCNHLTSFGILLQVNRYEQSQTDKIVLDTITNVLLGISLVSLTLLLPVYCFFRDLWKSTRIFIHTNLVINMIATYILFLTGIDSKSEKICLCIGVGLHFTVVNMFMWMMAEAIFIALKVTKTVSVRRNMPRNYFIVCYSISLIIVGTTLAVDVKGNYKATSPCWLNNNNGAIYALVIPALLIIALNMVILIMTLRTIYQKSKSRQTRSEKNYNESILKTMKATLFLLPIFGVTWVFGPFAFSSASKAFEYIFVILNCPQGVAIFIVYCVMDVEVKEQFKKWRERSIRLKEAKSVTQQEGSA